MATLSEQERKRIQRYCIYPKVAGAALAMAFVLPFLIIPFEMIDDIVFHHEGFQETGMIAALVLTAVELVIFCYCALAPRFGMRGKQWKEMQRRLAVEQRQRDRAQPGWRGRSRRCRRRRRHRSGCAYRELR